MSDRDRLIAQIMLHEGFRSKPYRCTAGKLTIGYGRNLDDVGISQGEAVALLREDMDRAFFACATLLPGDAWTRLTLEEPVRAAVLVNMAFNLGQARLGQFKKLLAAVRAGDWEAAADEMEDSAWHAQVGARAVELEAQMRTGKWRED